MVKVFRRALAALLIVASLLTAAIVGAEIKTYTGVGRYVMSDFENQDIAKKRALQRAKESARKQAGVYLTTYSRSVNFRLTDDDISAVTNNITNIVGEVRYERKTATVDGLPVVIWTATLEANVDTDGLVDYIKRDDKDKVTIVRQNNSLQEAIAKNDAQVADLKEQYKRATTQAERDRIRKQLNDTDRDFLANEKLEEGLALYYAKDYNGAIKLYDEALQLKPDWHWAYNNRGNAYSYLEQYEQAIKDFNKAIELNPNWEYPYNNLGTVYGRLGQYERAIQDLNKAIELNPNFADAYTNRGNAYDNLGQYERAIQDFNKAIALKPDFASAYNNRGVTYMNGLKQYERAIKDFNKAIELNSEYDHAYNNRGFAYDKQGQYERAIQDYDKAIALNPNLVEAYNNRGIAYALMGNFKQAIADATKAIELNPNYTNAYQLRGICYRELGNMKKARADFAKAKALGYKG